MSILSQILEDRLKRNDLTITSADLSDWLRRTSFTNEQLSNEKKRADGLQAENRRLRNMIEIAKQSMNQFVSINSSIAELFQDSSQARALSSKFNKALSDDNPTALIAGMPHDE